MTGVGLVTLAGGQRPAVRVQANPKALAANGLGLEDLRMAITAANVKRAKGNIDTPSRSYVIDANDQLRSAAEYRAVVVAYRNGAPVFLSDVAEVVEDAENVRLAAWMNEVPAIIVNIQRQPGTNVIEVVDRIKRQLPQLTASLPAAVDVAVLTDRTITIRASVRDVQIEEIAEFLDGHCVGETLGHEGIFQGAPCNDVFVGKVVFVAVEHDELDAIILLVDFAAGVSFTIFRFHEPTLVFGSDVIRRPEDRMDERGATGRAADDGEFGTERECDETSAAASAGFYTATFSAMAGAAGVVW